MQREYKPYSVRVWEFGDLRDGVMLYQFRREETARRLTTIAHRMGYRASMSYNGDASSRNTSSRNTFSGNASSVN